MLFLVHLSVHKSFIDCFQNISTTDTIAVLVGTLLWAYPNLMFSRTVESKLPKKGGQWDNLSRKQNTKIDSK